LLLYSSLHSTAFLQSSILGLVDFELEAHITSVNFSEAQDRKSQSEHNTRVLNELIVQLDPVQNWAIVHARDSGSF